MRSSEDLFEELEEDISSRLEEIRLIQMLANKTKRDNEIRMLRRSLVLLTYAHFEGFCKFALIAYLSQVNALSIKCKEASLPLATATLSDLFFALRNVNKKHKLLDSDLPNDHDLKMIAREQAFLLKQEDVLSRTVNIPDRVVDTQSNLNAMQLKKNLFKLGLEHKSLEPHEGKINKLLGVRNAIAHGDRLKEPNEEETSEYIESASEMMRMVQNEVFQSIEYQKYLKKT